MQHFEVAGASQGQSSADREDEFMSLFFAGVHAHLLQLWQQFTLEQSAMFKRRQKPPATSAAAGLPPFRMISQT